MAMSYREFMERVGERLAGLTAEELRALLIHWASGIEAADREGFLPRLVVPAPDAQQDSEPDPEIAASIDLVLEDIAAFAKRVGAGEYAQGWGWDPDIGAEREFGDESWAEEVEGFLSEAHGLAQNHFFTEAARVYGELFRLLRDYEEPGFLPRPHAIDDMLSCSLEEEAALYLRSVYESATLPERADVLYGAMLAGDAFTRSVSLHDIRDCLLKPLPELQQFLPRWIQVLRQHSEHRTNKQLREATTLAAGDDGLRDLARSDPAAYPDAYLDWVNAVAAQQNPEATLAAVQEALTAVPADYTIRAKIAKQLAVVGRSLKNPDLILEAQQAAFHSDPSLPYLLDLLAIAWECGCFQKTKADAEQRLRQLLSDAKERRTIAVYQQHPTARADLSLIFHLHLLAGDHEKALAHCQQQTEDWSYWTSHPIGVLLQWLLLRLAGKGEHRQLVERLWRQALVGADTMSMAQRGFVAAYNAQLHRVRHSFQFSVEQEKAYLKWCRQQVEAFADRIVSQQYRHSYGEAAERVVALAEVYRNRQEQRRAVELIALYRNRFPRHRSFQQELQRAVEEAGLNGST